MTSRWLNQNLQVQNVVSIRSVSTVLHILPEPLVDDCQELGGTKPATRREQNLPDEFSGL